MSELKPPLLIIGATRSGKSTLAGLLSVLPDICRWAEPNALLRTGYAYRSGHAANVSDARPWVKRHIERACLRYQQAHGGRRIIIDADGLAVLKIPFLHAVFPRSRMVYVYRDGRTACAVRVRTDASNSAYDLRNPAAWNRFVSQVRQMKWWEVPASFPRFVTAVLRRYVLRKPVAWQGITYGGWEEDQRTLSPHQLELKRWKVAVETALDHLEALPRDVWMSVRFEDMIAEPERCLRDIAAFASLHADEAYIERAGRMVRDRSRREAQPPIPDDLGPVMPAVAPLLRRLGYE